MHHWHPQTQVPSWSLVLQSKKGSPQSSRRTVVLGSIIRSGGDILSSSPSDTSLRESSASHLLQTSSLRFTWVPSTRCGSSSLPPPCTTQPKPQPLRMLWCGIPHSRIFTGGLGLQPREVGAAMAILGVIGFGLQLGLYPCLSAPLGTVRSWRFFLLSFPITYFLVPYLSLVPSSSPPPSPKDGIAVWVAMARVLALQVAGRTFVLPAQTILVNNCTPHPGVLGTVHGIGQSVSSFARTLGP